MCECGWRVSIRRGRRTAVRWEAKVVLPFGIGLLLLGYRYDFFCNRLPLGGNDK